MTELWWWSMPSTWMAVPWLARWTQMWQCRTMNEFKAFYLTVTFVNRSIFVHAYHFAVIREIGQHFVSVCLFLFHADIWHLLCCHIDLCTVNLSYLMHPYIRICVNVLRTKHSYTIQYLRASSIYGVILYEHPNWTVKLLSPTCLFRFTLVTCIRFYHSMNSTLDTDYTFACTALLNAWHFFYFLLLSILENMRMCSMLLFIFVSFHFYLLCIKKISIWHCTYKRWGAIKAPKIRIVFKQ